MNSLGNMIRVRGLRHRPKEPAPEVHEEEVMVHGITKGPGTHGKCRFEVSGEAFQRLMAPSLVIQMKKLRLRGC